MRQRLQPSRAETGAVRADARAERQNKHGNYRCCFCQVRRRAGSRGGRVKSAVGRVYEDKLSASFRWFAVGLRLPAGLSRSESRLKVWPVIIARLPAPQCLRMFAIFSEILGITAPVFAMLFLGLLLKRLGQIDAAFISTATSLVFNVSMPAMLFLAILHADLRTALQPALLGYFVLATVVGFLLVWGWALWRVPRVDRGVYVQGAFRGNNGIIGLALATSLYGDYGLSLGGVLGGVVILSYNSLSAIVLAIYSPNAKASVWSISKNILRNPLILGVLAAIPFAYWQFRLPAWLTTSGEYLAQLTLPLALICIGATLSLASLRESGKVALGASVMKMVWLPLLGTLGAFFCGFREAELGILFLFFASPTAAASFVMAKAAGANHQLAAAIIVITTLAAAITTNIGLFVLQWGGWI